MHNRTKLTKRRLGFALAVPLVAVGAIVFTAQSTLGSPGPVPRAVAATGPVEQLKSGVGGLTNRTFKVPSGVFTFVPPPKTTAPASASMSPTKSNSASPSSATPSASASSATPSGSASGTAGGGAAGAPIKNCAGSQVAAPLTVKVATVGNHQALVDGDGCTLYLFNKDTSTTSACDQACVAAWPPAPGPGTAGAGVTQNNLGTFSRSNGSTQVSYFGHQLYYFTGDKAPGDANGEGIQQSFFMVDPSGNAITQ